MSIKETDQKLDRLIELVEMTLLEKKEDKTYRDTHREEHRFLRTIMAESEARTVFWRSVANKVISGGIWALIISVFGAVLFSFKYYLIAKPLI